MGTGQPDQLDQTQTKNFRLFRVIESICVGRYGTRPIRFGNWLVHLEPEQLEPT